MQRIADRRQAELGTFPFGICHLVERLTGIREALQPTEGRRDFGSRFRAHQGYVQQVMAKQLQGGIDGAQAVTQPRERLTG
ncbi:hypothetical protein D3C87_1962910 [compost metagenome]